MGRKRHKPEEIVAKLRQGLWCKFWKGNILFVKAPSENENFYAEY